MKTFKIWNKKDDINGVGAKYIINSHNIKEDDEIFLIIDETTISEIQFKNTIISNYNLDASLTCEEVARKYLEIKAQEKNQMDNDIITIEQQQKELDELKKQNADMLFMMMQGQGGAI